jgi:two-component system cell cycle sensor histidine kinase/response regulator CckA
VYGIVGSHGGYIEVESELNKGTTFRVYLPAASQFMAGTESRSRADEAIPRGTETILIVEDEGDLRQVLELVLTSAGYKVVACADGEQALRLYSSRAVEIALVIADRGLPVLSGDEVFRRVRAINPQAKVILASGFIEPDLKSELLKAGVQDFIQKPYTLNEVLRKTRSVLDVKS